MFAAGGALLLGGGVANYLLASHPSMTPQEDLTLANLEAMAFMDPDKDMDPDGEEKKYSYMKGSSCTIIVGTQAIKGYRPNCFSGWEYSVCADCVAE